MSTCTQVYWLNSPALGSAPVLHVPAGSSGWSIREPRDLQYATRSFITSGKLTTSPANPHAASSMRYNLTRWRYKDGYTDDSVYKEGDISILCRQLNNNTTKLILGDTN